MLNYRSATATAEPVIHNFCEQALG